MELTLNERTMLWHVHLHVLFTGSYAPLQLVRLAWHEKTGDSFVVDVRELHKREAAVSYCVKYLSKPVPSNVWNSDSALQEAIEALHGTHQLLTFGTWRGMRLTAKPDAETGWIPVAPLHVILAKAKAGDAESLLVCRAIHADTDGSDNPHVRPIDSG